MCFKANIETIRPKKVENKKVCSCGIDNKNLLILSCLNESATCERFFLG